MSEAVRIAATDLHVTALAACERQGFTPCELDPADGQAGFLQKWLQAARACGEAVA